jgi:hypothetical protein
MRLYPVILATAVVIVWQADAESRARAACNIDSIGVGTSLATTSGDIVLGKAWGETFSATDTLIKSVSVWRIAPEHNDSSSVKFWITEVDSFGTPHTHLVVFDGPTIFVVSPDSTRPTKIEFDFDPPISLPRQS